MFEKIDDFFGDYHPLSDKSLELEKGFLETKTTKQARTWQPLCTADYQQATF